MRVTEILVKEHSLILEKLDALKNTLQLPLSENVSEIEKAIEFIIEYADKFHHAKEEDIYFKWICEQNPMFAEAGPVQVMLHEHAQGRALIENATQALESYKSGDSEKQELVKSSLNNFIHLLVAHIDKENNILYPMADGMDQNGNGDEAMLPEFTRIEKKYAKALNELMSKAST